MIWQRDREGGGGAGVHRVPMLGDEGEGGSKVQAAMISSGRLLPPSECLPGALEVCRETQEKEVETEEELVMLLLLLLVAQVEEEKEADEEGTEAETVGKVAQGRGDQRFKLGNPCDG